MPALTTRLATDLDAAFPDYVRSHQQGVFSGAWRMLGDRHEAEDVAQETFVRAYRALGTYDGERIQALRLAGWTWTIGANLCRNRLAARKRPHAVLAANPPSDPADLAAAADERLTSALAALPWVQRAAVVLRYVSDLPYRDIAEALDRPESTVRSDVRRGLNSLKKRLETP